MADKAKTKATKKYNNFISILLLLLKHFKHLKNKINVRATAGYLFFVPSFS